MKKVPYRNKYENNITPNIYWLSHFGTNSPEATAAGMVTALIHFVASCKYYVLSFQQ